jgi:hypothetical protein
MVVVAVLVVIENLLLKLLCFGIVQLYREQLVLAVPL